MFCYFRALDPGRSLATAFAWFSVVLTLVVASALVVVGDYASDSMLAQRDAQMHRFAQAFAALVEPVLARSGPGALPPAPQLVALADEARRRTKPDARAVVWLCDARRGVVFAHPAGSVRLALPPLLPDGVVVSPEPEGARTVLVSVPREAAPALAAAGLQVVVAQPADEGAQAGHQQEKLTAISVLLSVTAALVGAAFARRLTRRLGQLTHQVRLVARQEAGGIAQTSGRDEVAVLGRAFSRLLQALRQEHEQLDRLTQDLEARVQARTREVERLAADSRYAAVVRERLRFARDLHDTLAHSMMAMLVELRTLRTLHAHRPDQLGAELERAEELARQGLREAREAVGQMRLNAVRDLGLGPALQSAVNRFTERTGLQVCFDADPEAASFADARAETLFRIAEEALRNIDRHAQAKSVAVTLKNRGSGTVELAITDDGIGFDPAAPHPGHYGVVGIREHAQLIDAELVLRSAPGAGAMVAVRLRVGPEMRVVEHTATA